MDSITFGDPDGIDDSETLDEEDNGLVVEWGGFDAGTTGADFTIFIAGTSGGDGGSWTGGGETTASEALATGSETLTGTNGSATFTWTDVFGEPQPVDVTAHTEIALSDFEADTNNATTVRELEVTIEVVVPDEDELTATATTTATITVNNQDVTIEFGGQGTFEIESDEEVVE
ncbi:hypothetical protein HALLA_20300 (plasmid) [Halostagnicola larsenii XH-48]|uniref:Uncharacterized protein n=1 Tax=Halostagnicola larsenii XH-48 TaxID=797299 RepID=W0JYG4_9EURY|nr:hypothetical protein HALLA_20300 [Halostagnicola larsenii XH-48]